MTFFSLAVFFLLIGESVALKVRGERIKSSEGRAGAKPQFSPRCGGSFGAFADEWVTLRYILFFYKKKE